MNETKENERRQTQHHSYLSRVFVRWFILLRSKKWKFFIFFFFCDRWVTAPPPPPDEKMIGGPSRISASSASERSLAFLYGSIPSTWLYGLINNKHTLPLLLLLCLLCLLLLLDLLPLIPGETCVCVRWVNGLTNQKVVTFLLSSVWCESGQTCDVVKCTLLLFFLPR